MIKVVKFLIWLVRWYLMILGYVGLIYSSLVHKMINFYTVTGTILAILLFCAYLLYVLLDRLGTMLIKRYGGRH
ncbi:unnamed protein product [Fructobacillus fructosus]|uniref:Uncharacterized protein n=1 Tax=Fructobacillus fructosus TaxID=1631 RepID=A0ABM9N075_9LACO|nr:unnamed protein product [Fructobacillus fructosus]CAK1228822.1 unnamed protein product [Fructobacillus fructosus]CAK1235945.1 unnamed protein product [Fructobacillus fructosus]CAK1245616.1 unnamed protein product [Fructobacillus fructosus]CAK1252263.1 unnamed protein product [Fructobacillus fructosus]